MVDIIHDRPGIDELDQELDDLDDIGIGEHPDRRIDGQGQLLVQPVAAYVAQIVTLLGEEELLDDVAGGCLIRRFGIAELFVDVVDSLDFRIGRVLLKGVENDGVLVGIGLILLKENRLHFRFPDLLDGFVIEDLTAFDDGDGTFDGNDLARIFILEVLGPGFEHLGGQFPAFVLFEGGFVGGDLVGQSENVDDVLVGVVTDGAEQGGNGQLLLSVDVGVHHVVDVRRELDPGTLERDDTRRIQLGAVGVHALVEEDTGGAVQLRDDNALRSVDDEGAGRGHVRDASQINVLDFRVEILMLGICAGKAEFCLQRNAVSESSLKTLLDRILRRIDEIVDELQPIVVSGIFDRENFLENLIQALSLTVFGRGFQLEEIVERLQLDFEQVRVLQNLRSCEVNSLIISLF